jgi:hypothetical protein
MIVSLNEVEVMSYRAALGVGLTHGLAEDAAHIAARLVTASPDGLAIMLRALHSADKNRVAAPVFVRDGTVWRSRYPFLPSLHGGPVAAGLRLAQPGVEIEMAATDEPAILDICLTAAKPIGPEISRLAARTYVPASRTSRLMGAGAGSEDND